MDKGIYKSAEGKQLIARHYETYVNSFPFEVERMYVSTSYGSTHVLAAGPLEGKPVFILQGGNCINPMTLSWFLSLVHTYRVYAPDTIGHPGYSEERRMCATDDSFAKWIEELMDHFHIDRCAFVGPSYGAGITLRLAAHMPNKISCSVLISPAGIRLGSKLKMIKNILLPLLLFHATSSKKHLTKITDVMSDYSMKEMDAAIIGDVFRHVRLEQEMPKLTEKKELAHYDAPTLIIAGRKDIFFPEDKLKEAATEMITNLTDFKSYDMGHFPSESHLVSINKDIMSFLASHY